MKTHEIGRDKLQLEQLIGSQSATELVSRTEYSVQTKGVGHIREVQYSVLSPLFLHGIIVALGQNSMLPYLWASTFAQPLGEDTLLVLFLPYNVT